MNARILAVPAVIAAFSVAVIRASLQLDLSPPMIVGHSMQPRAFPIFLMGINLVLVVVLVAQMVRRPPRPDVLSRVDLHGRAKFPKVVSRMKGRSCDG